MAGRSLALLVSCVYVWLCALFGTWATSLCLASLGVSAIASLVLCAWQGHLLPDAVLLPSLALGPVVLVVARILMAGSMLLGVTGPLEVASGALVGLGASQLLCDRGPRRPLDRCSLACALLLLMGVPLSLATGLWLGSPAPGDPPHPSSLWVPRVASALLVGGADVATRARMRTFLRVGPPAVVAGLAAGVAVASLVDGDLRWALAQLACCWPAALVAQMALHVRRGRVTRDEALLAFAGSLLVAAVLASQDRLYGASLFVVGARFRAITSLSLALAVGSGLAGGYLALRGRGDETGGRATACRVTARPDMGRMRRIASHAGLSQREREVMVGVANGETVGQTGERLGISAGTVGTYRARLYKKVGVSGSAQLTTLVVVGEGQVGEGPVPGRAVGCRVLARRLVAVLLLAWFLLPCMGDSWVMVSTEHLKPLSAVGFVAAAALCDEPWLRSQLPGGLRVWSCASLLLAVALALLASWVTFGRLTILADGGWALYLVGGASCLLPLVTGTGMGMPVAPVSARRHLPLASRTLLMAVSGWMVGVAMSRLEPTPTGGSGMVPWVGVLGLALLVGLVMASDAGWSPAGAWSPLPALPLCVGVLCGTGPLASVLVLDAPEGVFVALLLGGLALGSLSLVLTFADVRMLERSAEPGRADAFGALLESCGLTEAEREVARLLARGFGAPEVAVRRGVSAHTVATHREAVYAKFGVHSQRELIALAASMGGDGGEAR